MYLEQNSFARKIQTIGVKPNIRYLKRFTFTAPSYSSNYANYTFDQRREDFYVYNKINLDMRDNIPNPTLDLILTGFNINCPNTMLSSKFEQNIIQLSSLVCKHPYNVKINKNADGTVDKAIITRDYTSGEYFIYPRFKVDDIYLADFYYKPEIANVTIDAARYV